jgi:hypothetical protein
LSCCASTTTATTACINYDAIGASAAIKALIGCTSAT